MAGTSTRLQNNRFINSASTAVTEALMGHILSNHNVALFDFAKVVVRRDYETMEEVKILSGGASGHEPAFAGFVGKGMLTASVQGDIYVSPPTADILRTIEELSTGNSLGILVIIPNNSGDRLNFGLAVERAQNMSVNIRLLLIRDDCCSFQKPRDKRGLSGVFVVQKIAGALAQTGNTLDQIYSFCSEVEKDLYSLTISIKRCSEVEKGVCETCKFVLTKTEVEIGAGLHGECGRLQILLTDIEYICKVIFDQMTDENNEHHLNFEPDVPLVVFINNLGTTSKLEENIITKEVLNYLTRLEIKIARFFCGRFLSSVEMYGFTITILKVRNPDILNLLDVHCEAPCWDVATILDPRPETFIIESKYKPQEVIELRGPRLNKRQSNILLLVTQFACDALKSCERQLNVIDAETGDGDCGSRIKRAVDTIDGKLMSLNLNFPFSFFLSLSDTIETQTGGTTGCLYGIMFEAAAKEFITFPESHLVDAWLWMYALKRAVAALHLYANVEEGECTLYDPLITCARVMEESLIANIVSPVECFGLGVAAAEEAAQKTKVKPMKYPDPGAHAAAIWLRAVFEGVKFRCE